MQAAGSMSMTRSDELNLAFERLACTKAYAVHIRAVGRSYEPRLF